MVFTETNRQRGSQHFHETSQNSSQINSTANLVKNIY